MRASTLGSAITAALCCACARYQYVGVYSEPPAAEVHLDTRPVGRTPLRLRIERGAAHVVYVKREGYRPQLVVLDLVRAPDGVDYLTPPDVEVQLVPLGSAAGRERDLSIEAEPAAPE